MYPQWWDRTITVYNKYIDPITHIITWYKNVIDSCFIKDAGNKIHIDKVTLDTESIICRIPKQNNFITKDIWLSKPNDYKCEFLTLSPGDIIILAETDDEIDEYTDGKRSSDILNKYRELQGCMTVEKVLINVGSGRCNEHYYVKGV